MSYLIIRSLFIRADEESLIEALDDAALGQYFSRMGRAVASVRGRVAQDENYFMDSQRDLQVQRRKLNSSVISKQV